MTEQEELQYLLNVSVNHIRKQGRGSYHQDGYKLSCRYQGPDNTSCAAAPFIKEWDPLMEGHHFESVAKRWPDNVDIVARANAEFVRDALQRAHDNAVRSTLSNPEDFMEAYEWELGVAVDSWNQWNGFNLQIPAAS